MDVKTVPYTPSAEDNAVGTVPLTDAEATAMATGQMQPGVSLEDGPTGPDKPAEPAKPEIPEKFLRDGKLDQDALLKSYQELERKLGEPKEPAKEPDTEGSSEDQNTKADEGSEPKDKPDTEPDRFTEYADKIAQKGGLEEADFEKLQKDHGISREMAETYVRGYQAQIQLAQQQLFQKAGIKDHSEYNQIVDWAAKSLTQAEKDAFDKAVTVDNGAAADWALQGLKARYVQANGQVPNLVKGDRTGSGNAGFQSRTEFMEMIDSPGYRSNDPGVHAAFQAKLKATPVGIRRDWLGGIDKQTTLGRR